MRGIAFARVDPIVVEAGLLAPSDNSFVFTNVVAKLEARWLSARPEPDDQVKVAVREPTPLELLAPLNWLTFGETTVLHDIQSTTAAEAAA